MNRSYYKQPSRLMLICMFTLGPLLILSGGINLSNGSSNAELYTQSEGIVIDKSRRRRTLRITYYYTYNRTVALGHMSAQKLDKEMRNRFAMKRNESEDMDQLTDRYILKAEQDDRGVSKGLILPDVTNVSYIKQAIE